MRQCHIMCSRSQQPKPTGRTPASRSTAAIGAREQGDHLHAGSFRTVCKDVKTRWKRTWRARPPMCQESSLEPRVLARQLWEVWTCGISWSEREVSDLAQQVKHPFDGQPTIPDVVKKKKQPSGSPWEEQQASPKGWQVRPEHGVAKRLTSELPRPTSTPRCWPTLKGKPLLLFKRMLQSNKHLDVRVADNSAVIFNVANNVPVSGVFEGRTAYKSIPGNGCGEEWWTSDASLVENSRIGRRTDKGSLRQDHEGSRQGLGLRLTHSQQVDVHTRPRWIPGRRFGIVQGGKTWPIDAFTGSLANRAVSCLENMSVDGADRVASMAKMCVGSGAEFRRCRSGPQHRQGSQGMQASQNAHKVLRFGGGLQAVPAGQQRGVGRCHCSARPRQTRGTQVLPHLVLHVRSGRKYAAIQSDGYGHQTDRCVFSRAAMRRVLWTPSFFHVFGQHCRDGRSCSQVFGFTHRLEMEARGQRPTLQHHGQFSTCRVCGISLVAGQHCLTGRKSECRQDQSDDKTWSISSAGEETQGPPLSS